MTGRNILIQLTYFVVFLVLEFLGRNMVIGNFAFYFSYVGFILFLPRTMGPVWLLLSAFGYGLLVDVFYDTLGIHAAASVLLAFLKPVHLKLVVPSGGYEAADEISIESMGFRWFMWYTFPLIFVHHLALFAIEAANFSLLHFVLLKAVFSTLFTFVILSLVQGALFSPQSKR